MLLELVRKLLGELSSGNYWIILLELVGKLLGGFLRELLDITPLIHLELVGKLLGGLLRELLGDAH